VTMTCATLEAVTDPAVPPHAGTALSAADLVAATGGRLVQAGTLGARGGAVDSRLVRPGTLFAALPGERTDGHRFLRQAVDNGATALLVSRDHEAEEPRYPELGDVTVVRVPDTLLGLQQVAAAWRRRFDPLVVGITGSIAKTSTKESVAGVLEGAFRTLRSEGNRNNEVGLPLTVLELGPEHGAAVLEMGMYAGGEIRDLAAIGLPSIGIVTAVQPVHLSRLGTIEAIEDAKAELVEALPPAADGGVAILNADDARVARMAVRTRARVTTYGLDAPADVSADAIQSAGFEGMRFRVRTPSGDADASIPGLGRLAVHNALAATAAGLAAGMSLEAILPGLAAPSRAEHRSTVIHAGGVTIVDDAYNASPGSMRAALELLAGLPGRHLAVLGEMRELGSAHDEGHLEVGRAAAGLDLLVVVDGAPGGAAAGIVEGAREAGDVRAITVADTDAAVAIVAGEARPGDVVLVKASRGVELERVVDGLVSKLGGADRW
jgi:UDP-N-acetylmuramoyl-tripeptide--D-alanyl-D-alanine ligase